MSVYDHVFHHLSFGPLPTTHSHNDSRFKSAWIRIFLHRCCGNYLFGLNLERTSRNSEQLPVELPDRFLVHHTSLQVFFNKEMALKPSRRWPGKTWTRSPCAPLFRPSLLPPGRLLPHRLFSESSMATRGSRSGGLCGQSVLPASSRVRPYPPSGSKGVRWARRCRRPAAGWLCSRWRQSSWRCSRRVAPAAGAGRASASRGRAGSRARIAAWWLRWF